MGRAKLEIKKIENATNRQVTYSKRRNGLLKKAYELSVLCDIDIVVLMYSPSGKLTTHCRPETTIEDVLQRFVDTPAQERTKRRDENLQLLEKIVRKLNAEKEGRGWNPAEQSDVAAKQRQIEHLKSCIQHSPSLEDLVMARIQQSASIAELEQLERSMENGLLQVQNQRRIVQGMESLRIRQHFNQHFQQHVQQPAPQNPGEQMQFCFAGPSNSAGTPLPQFCFAGPSNSAEISLPQFLPVPMQIDNPYLQTLQPMQQWQPQSSAILQAQAKGKGQLNEERFADIGQASGAPTMDNPDLQNLHPMQQSQGLPDLESHYQYLRRLFPAPAQSSSIRQAKGNGQLEEERVADIGQASGAPAAESSASASTESDFDLSTIPYNFADQQRDRRF